MQWRAASFPTQPADSVSKHPVQLYNNTAHHAQLPACPASTASAGGSCSVVICMKKVGLGAPPGAILPPEIHYGGLACLQASLDPD